MAAESVTARPAAASFDPSLTHIAYLHAWPLIGKLGTGDPFPIKKLDFDSERALLFNTLNQANKAIRLQMEVATSDNLLRLITMGCRAIHYTGHGMPSCFPSHDTRILTNHGMLFLHEVRAHLQADTEVLYACFDVASQQLVYRAGELIAQQHEGDLIDFTQQGDQRSWNEQSDSTKPTDLAGQSSNLSLRVTPKHDMYVQRGEKFGGQFAKVPAKELFATDDSCLRMMTCAESGVGESDPKSVDHELRSTLRLTTSDQVTSFLELYGIWLRNGSLDNLHHCIRLGQSDALRLREILPRVGLSSGEWRESELSSGRSEFVITAACWWNYFEQETGKSLFSWWRRCDKSQLQLIIAGLRRAGNDRVIYTSSVLLRDELAVLMLHAGYSASFSPSDDDSWSVTYAEPSSSVDELACRPVLECKTDVRREKYSGEVWCVKVDHPDHLIMAERVQRNEVGVVTRASRPVVVGQCLAFEDDEGKMHPMDPAQLKELVEAGRSCGADGGHTGIEFVFVSACHSESAGLAFVAAGVPHVIAVKTEAAVCDRASQVFMNHFYLALLVGKTVRASFDIGQKAVRHNPRLNGGDEPRKFLLLPEGADHERTLFTDIPPGRWTDASAPSVPHTIPAIPDNFLGRNFMIQKVRTAFYSLLAFFYLTEHVQARAGTNKGKQRGLCVAG